MSLQTNIKIHRKVALAMAFLLSFQMAFPVGLFALTTGPAQPEFSSFEPVGTTQMVDLFSGDFVYNIPLFELPGPDGGYPFNLAYHSGITMDQEASWVGLGWTMNNGAITRTARGLPDEFNGDQIRRKTDMKPNKTWNFQVAAHAEFFGYQKPKGDDPGKNGKLKINLAISTTHNNYKGWGAGLNLGLNTDIISNDNYAFTGGLNMGFNSFEGASLSPSLSLGFKKNEINANIRLSGRLNSREGLTSLSLGQSLSETKKRKEVKEGKPESYRRNIGELNAQYSFGMTAYTPQVNTGYRGMNFSGSVELGGWTGANNFGGDINVSFSKQELKNRNIWTSVPAYGFFHMKDRSDPDLHPLALMDFNREKEGPVRQNSPNLAAPITTPDIYSVVGQGIGGSYRAYRSDVGILTDPIDQSLTGGGVLGGELGFGGGADLGGNLGGNWALASTNIFDADGLPGLVKYDNEKLNTDYEPYYFKAAGEMTAEDLVSSQYHNIVSNERAVKLKLKGNPNSIGTRLKVDGGVLQYKDGATSLIGQNKRAEGKRKPRGNNLQQITNKELMGGGTKESLKEYQVEYFDYNQYLANGSDYLRSNYNPNVVNGPLINRVALDRTGEKEDHIAGMTALHPGGMRYVYGLPVKNKLQKEYVFSIKDGGLKDVAKQKNIPTLAGGNEIDYKGKGDDDYLDITETPEFTHSHLLTAVLGADYVDLDHIPGPSDGDYGYWVKFNYVKTSTSPNGTDDPYKWKAPYEGANFIKGALNDKSDAKGSFMYGEREQYYLATAESRTHLAVFHIQERADAAGVSTEFQNSTTANLGKSSFLLHKITLHSKLELEQNSKQAIKTVYFDYDYHLCQGVDNNNAAKSHQNHDGVSVNNEGGKLSLKKIWFTYEDSHRGSLSPYQFKYASLNPDYNGFQYDRWGTYQYDDIGLFNNALFSNNFPYTYQKNRKNGGGIRLADYNASAWHLTNIQLPSGANINVEYESDDYAYVQDRKAMAMYKINRVSDLASGKPDRILNTRTLPENFEENEDLKVYVDVFGNASKDANSDDVRRCFSDLHKVPKYDAENNIMGYEYQVFFKILIDLLNSPDASGADNQNEFVSGYASIQVDANGEPIVGFSNAKNSAFFYLKPVEMKFKGVKRYYHPFCFAAWQKLKLEHADKLNEESLDNYDDVTFKKAIGAIGKAIGELGSIFKNFYHKCSIDDYANEIDLSKSYVRLNVGDMEKEGGGSRVKQIKLVDNWDIDEDGSNTNDEVTYGQVYDYTKRIEEYGKEIVISSGVAINEPAIGGEESALRYAKHWVGEAMFKSPENLFFEYPINESYYPGAGVGYSKVTVKSLATHLKMNPAAVNNPNSLPADFATTGVTINEFYTAKDFPVLVEETLLESRIHTPRYLSFLVGSKTNDKYLGSQGYSIILNDMHGKPHKVTHIGMNVDGELTKDTLSKVEYTYLVDENKVYHSASNQRVVKSLKNTVDVLDADGNRQAVIQSKEMGVDYELMFDLRESESRSGSGSLGINADYTPALIFVVTAFPSMSNSHSRTQTAVSNKVIRKSGILIRTDAYDGQSLITTTNKVFDPLTGEPLLTTVNNSFDNPIYNYNLPARYVYDRMGPAYENWGMHFTGSISTDFECGAFKIPSLPDHIKDKLNPGDECIVIEGCENTADLCDYPTFTVMSKVSNGNVLFENKDIPDGLEVTPVTMMITRSGKRNHLTAKAANITALKDPTVNRDSSTGTAYLHLPQSANTATLPKPSLGVFEMDEVLNASAVTYSDSWDLERADCDVKTRETTVVTTPPCECRVIMQLRSVPQGICDYEPEPQYVSGTQEPPNPLGWTLCSAFSPPADGIIHGNCIETTNTQCKIIACSNTGFAGFSVPIGQEVNLGDMSDCVDTVNNRNWFLCWWDIPAEDAQCVGLPDASDTTVYVNNVPTEDFSLGQKGVWRPFRNFTYVQDRLPANLEPSAGYDLENDGTIKGAVPMFDWKNPFYTLSNKGENWKMTNEISKYGINGEEIENRDIIGLYSTALYGYKDNLPIAVASNASHYEIAYEGFEEYTGVDLLEDQGNGNWNFECLGRSEAVSLNYNIVGAYQGGNFIWIDKEYYPGMPVPSEAELTLYDEAGNQSLLNVTIKNVTGVSVDANNLDLPFRETITSIELDNRVGCNFPGNTLFGGRVDLKYCFDLPANNCNKVTIADGIAHTGSKSMRIDSRGSIVFAQKTLQLVKGKTYVFSAWVRKEATNGRPLFTFNDQVIRIVLLDGVQSRVLRPTGEVIEGWQRIEGTYTYQGSDQSLELKLVKKIIDGSLVYFDDLRIYPEDGSLQTYVYDPANYRLRAVLDQNNYATFYQYDEEGNLFLVKKETAKGIKTIQETRSFVKPGPM